MALGDARKSGINGVAVVALLGGGLLAYSGVKGKKFSETVRSFLQGDPSAASTALPITAQTATAFTPGSGITGGLQGGGNPSKNQALAKLMAAPFGWSTGDQWNALVMLWNKESGWSNTADTRKSGLDAPNAAVYAYGIAQARPATKYGPLGMPPISSASVQIAWGLAYIKGRYGNPVNAWAHEQANNWY